MIFARLIASLSPKGCAVCARPGAYICIKCLSKAIKPRSSRCYRCNWGTSSGQLCIGCENYSFLAGTTIVAVYDGVARDLILSLKNHNDVWAAEVLGALIARAILRTSIDIEIVTAIPTSPQRYHERGYNPAEHLAKVVSRQLGLPYRPLLLRLNAAHQIGQTRSQRLQQINGAFYPIKPQVARQRSILVVDDVLTTGATLEEAARVLRRVGARSIWAAAVARH